MPSGAEWAARLRAVPKIHNHAPWESCEWAEGCAIDYGAMGRLVEEEIERLKEKLRKYEDAPYCENCKR